VRDDGDARNVRQYPAPGGNGFLLPDGGVDVDFQLRGMAALSILAARDGAFT
jgi:hypothetical protein